MTAWRVWFSAVGASQDPQRPWAVQAPDGSRYLAAAVVAEVARTVFATEGIAVPDGPRGLIECDGVVMVDAVRRET